jgi:hypothetical protein
MPRVTTQLQPIITTLRVEAYVASALRLLSWLLGALLRIRPSGRGARLKHVLSHAEFAVECILFLKAVALYGPPPQRRPHPRSTPPGFRRSASNRRAFFKSAKIRARNAGPIARVMALFDALTHPESAVAYFFKQICRGLRSASLVAVAPPALVLAHEARIACASCDTS